MNIESMDEYQDKVFNYLDYIGLADYLIDFNEHDIARSFAAVIAVSYSFGISWRKTAITIFSLTLNYQVMPLMESLKQQNKVN